MQRFRISNLSRLSRRFLCLFLLTHTTTVVAMSQLAGQRVLITGAGRGIGRAMAVICSQQGAQVAISSRTESELQETISQATSVCSSDNKESTLIMDSYVADVTNQQQVDAMVSSIVKKWGGIDVLINNAGRNQASKGPTESLDSDELLSLLNLNVVAIHRVTSAVLNQSMLQNGGKIINISSKAGKIGIPSMGLYVTSKFAVEGLTASWAAELADKNIQINSLSPGMVDTQSFPKAPGKAGVRSAESVQDGLMLLLRAGVTGHYLHVDELDQVRGKGVDDMVALKPINEPTFDAAAAEVAKR